VTEDEQKQKHVVTLNKLLKEGFWTLSVDEEQNIRTAAKWALLEIDRLKTKTNRLRDTIRSVADTKLVENCELYQHLHADDLTKEVIE
jgi:hypothetical protein